MDQQTLLVVLTVFVAVAALALLIQMATMLGMYILTKRIEQKLMPLVPQVERVLETSGKTVTEAQRLVGEATTKVGAMLDLSKAQVDKVDTFLTDATTRARVQMARAELVLDDTMGRTQQAVAIVQRGVLAPVREVQGVLSGLRAGLVQLARGRRPSVDHATADEEMFI